MQTRTLASLAIAAVAVAGAAFYVSASRERPPANDHANELVYPDLAKAADRIARIEIARFFAENLLPAAVGLAPVVMTSAQSVLNSETALAG